VHTDLPAQVPRGSVCGVPAPDSGQSVHKLWTLGAWVAGGTHEPLKTRNGHVDDRALYLSGVSVSRVIAQGKFGRIAFTPTLVPAIIATANREYALEPYPSGGEIVVPYKKDAFGAGLIPLALEGSLPISDGLGIIIGAGGGAAYFNRRIPDPDETRFNFLADGHASVYIRSSIGVTTIGFRLQHISNGNTGRVNPGMDSRLLYFGYSR
jgi:hypothetical protein